MKWIWLFRVRPFRCFPPACCWHCFAP